MVCQRNSPLPRPSLSDLLSRDKHYNPRFRCLLCLWSLAAKVVASPEITGSTVPANPILHILSSDKPFLNFFYRRLRANTTGQHLPHFPYLSVCGNEHNFYRCDDTPIVYHTLCPADDIAGDTRKPAAAPRSDATSSASPSQAPPSSTSSASTATPVDAPKGPSPATENAAAAEASTLPHVLVYAGTLTVPFDPALLRMTETGRLYYPAPNPRRKGPPLLEDGSLSLIASHLALALSEDMTFGETTHINWHGRSVAIDASLPD